MREQHPRIRAAGVEVLAVAPTGLAEAARVAASLPFPLLADPGLDVFRAYRVESRLLSLGQRPALYAIDVDGIVRYAFLGTQQWQLGDVDEALAALARDA